MKILKLDKIELPRVIPLFDSIDLVEEGNSYVNQHITHVASSSVGDCGAFYEYTLDWLLENKHSPNNYKSYRSEITTFLHWCFCVEQISIGDVKRSQVSRYLDWCMSPPKDLIGSFNVPQFIDCKLSGERRPNPAWKPFTGKRSDSGEIVYLLSPAAIKSKLAILSTYFGYLINEEVMERNPAMSLMRSGRFKTTSQSNSSGEDNEALKSFSELQWAYVVETAMTMAEENPDEHERTLFMLSLMYSCYLRISEVSARPGYSPTMSQFSRDSKTGVWGFLIPKSKGNKRRVVAVSQDLLRALKRYRQFLGLSDLPKPGENIPLFVRLKKSSHGRQAGILNANLGDRQIREVLGMLFMKAAKKAEEDGFDLDAQEMRTMTPHSLRHTGISHDININQRPLSHVQADAGHDSIDTTSKYLHTSRTERHESASGKKINLGAA